MKHTITVIALLLGTSCAHSRIDSPTTAHTAVAAPIAWQRFGPSAFEEAKRSGKIVMVDAGIEGCTACRWMHEGPYRDADVVRKISDAFVPVAVDADQEPDLGDRFEPWGWPATIFFTADGKQVYALQGSESAREFAKLLDDIVAKKRAGTLEQGVAPVAHGAPADENVDLAAACVDAHTRLAKMSDENGFGGQERAALVGPFEDALVRARAFGNDKLDDLARAEAEGEAKIIDPVWGGIFVASFSKNWDSPIPEKRTVSEAAGLDAFALELHRTRDPRWRTRADLVRKYLEDWMLAPDGTFYSTQRDAAPRLPSNMSALDYYALGDAQRRAYGIPPIDHGVYTDQNAMVIQAYVRLYEATGDAALLAIAKRATDALLAKRTRADGGVEQAEPTAQLAEDVRLRATTPDSRLFLKAQGEMGLALLAMYEATADDAYLDAAKKIAKALPSLADADGAYFGTTAREVDALVSRKRPFVDNIAAARFLARLGAFTRDDALVNSAKRTLTVLASQTRYEGPWGLGLAALAYEEVLLGPVEITVVRGSDDAAARALHDEMLRVYEPRKLVRIEAAGHYPKPKGAAAIYVCTRVSCSSPVTTAAEARAVVDKMTLSPEATCK
jgi:hypothetical protein